MRLRVASHARELREREVGDDVLERLAGAAPRVRDRGDVVDRQPLVERRPLPAHITRQPSLLRSSGVGTVAARFSDASASFHVEVGRAERGDRRDRRRPTDRPS